MSSFLSEIVKNYDDLKYALLNAHTFDANHYGFPDISYQIMESDKHRIDVFKQSFEQYDNFKDAIVCEAGVGRLALTKLYLPYVKKAYLIESNPNIIGEIWSIIRANKWEDKVELIYGNAMTVNLPEKVDFVVGELMSIFCANEYQVQIFKQLRKFLKPEGKLIPEKIINLVQVGSAFFDKEYKHYPLFLTRHLPTTLTTLVNVNTTDLYNEEEEHVQRTTSFQAILSGRVNCVLLYSWIELAEGVNFTGSDSLMPPTVVKLEEEFELKAGQTYELHADYSYGTSLDEAKFWIS